MTDDLKVKVIIEAVNSSGAATEAVAKQFKGIEKAAENAARVSTGLLSRLSTAISKGQAAMNAAMAAGIASETFNRAAAPMRGMFESITESATHFQFAMAEVQAKLDDSNPENLDKLKKAALELGSSKFNPTEVAEGMHVLAQAGETTNKIIGAMPTYIRLAISENTSLAEAIGHAGDIMTGMGIDTSKAEETIDILAKAANASKIDLKDFSETMVYAGSAAHTVGMGIKDVSAVIEVLGQSGIRGSMAGTALQEVLMRIGANKEATKTLKRIGVEVEDIKTGNLLQPFQIIKNLQEKIGNLGSKKKLEILEPIFGDRAAKGAIAWLDSLASGDLAKRRKDLDAAGGSLKTVADILDNTAEGALRRYDAALEKMSITFGQTLVPGATSYHDAMAKLADKFSAFAEKHPGVIRGVLGVAAAITGLLTVAAGMLSLVTILASGYGLWLLVGAIGAWAAEQTILDGALLAGMPGIWSFAAGVLAAAWPILLIIGLVAGVTYAAIEVVQNWENVKYFFVELWDSIVSGAKTAWAWLSKIASAPGLRSIAASFIPALASQQSATLGGPAQTFEGPGGRQEVSGLIRMEFDSNGNPRVKEARTTGGLDFDFAAGATWVTQ